MSNDAPPPGAAATNDPPSEGAPATADHDDLESYAGGHIQGHHGSIQPWLLAVYAVLFLWALYYAYTYWGGLGPGLAN